jgi:Ca2+-binding RTX toxin-like protein
MKVVLSALLASLAYAAPAAALSVTSANGEMLVQAAPGESNLLQLSSGPRHFRLTSVSAGTPTTGGGCSEFRRVVSCRRPGVDRIVVNLGDENDRFAFALPSSSVPVAVSAGDGFDSVEYLTGEGPVTVSLDGEPNDGPGDRGDNIQPGVESLGGTLDGDSLTGSDLGDRLIGLGGEDQLTGLGGPDYLDSRDTERDVLSCGDGYDIADGNRFDEIAPDCELVARNDIVLLTTAGDRLTGWRLGLEIYAGGGDDRVRGLGTDILSGGSGDDVLRSGGGASSLTGGSGDDRLLGAGGDDNMAGGYGDDRLRGRSGRDYVWGGAGRDVLSGGPGADRIVSRERGGERDRVSCGRGRDLVVAGPGDVIDSSCERVDR